MSKWNLIIDVAKCENCHNCTLSVKDEYVGNAFPGYSRPQPLHGHEWIRIDRQVRGSGTMVDAAYLPTMCNHCDDAPCIKAGGGCVAKRADGIVLIDPDKARGRRDLVDACPYGAIWWNEEEQVPQHWFFDAHLLDQGWVEPRCSQACPTGAMKAVKVADAAMAGIAAEERLEVLRPDLGTKPRIWYANLHRFTKVFIGGEVLSEVGGKADCVEGAQVRLIRDGAQLAEATTDMFGNFKFDGLEPNGSAYVVEIRHSVGTARAEVGLETSVYLEGLLLG